MQSNLLVWGCFSWEDWTVASSLSYLLKSCIMGTDSLLWIFWSWNNCLRLAWNCRIFLNVYLWNVRLGMMFMTQKQFETVSENSKNEKYNRWATWFYIQLGLHCLYHVMPNILKHCRPDYLLNVLRETKLPYWKTKKIHFYCSTQKFEN